MRAFALRYALAPACVLAAVLLFLSPARPALSLAGLFVFAVLGAAWFGGAGPGFLAAVLATFTLPHVIAVDHPLLGGFLDVPRFITFSIEGLAVGWWSFRRGQMEAALRESEKRYELAINATNEGLWDWIVPGDRLYLSPRFLEIVGFAPGTTFTGRAAMFERLAMPDEDRAALEHAVADHFAGKTQRMEMQFRVLVHGEVRWIQATGQVTRDSSGKVVRWNGAARDVSARMRADEALRQSEERYQRTIAATGAEFWDWDVLADDFYASPRLLERIGFARDTRFSGRADFMQRAPFHPEDRAKWEAAVKDLFTQGGERLSMELRITVSGEVRWHELSGMCFRDAAGKVVRWTGSATDVHERKSAQEELRESEARFRALTELSADWYWRQDENLRFMYVSRQAVDTALYPDEWVIGKTREELPGITPLSFNWAEHQTALAAREPFRDYEYAREGRGGRVEYVSISGAPIFDEQGRFRGYQGVGRNITGRKRAEEALRNSEQRYALAMEAAGDGHTDWDLASGEFYISPRLLEIVGHAPDATFADRAEWVRRFPFHPEDRPKWETAIAAHFASQESHFKMELRIVVRGEVRWTSFHFLSTRNSAGTPIRWTGSIGDITEQKRFEEALRASEERYSLAMEASEEGYVDSDIDTDEFITSERLNEIFGIPRGTRFANRGEFLKHFRFYGDDANTYRDMISGVGTPGGPDRYEFEFRIVLRSGEVRWLWTRGKVTRDAAGHARRRIGMVADITARKVAEEALRESEERYERVVAATEAGFWDWNIVQDKYYVSPRLLEMAELPPGTVIAGREDFQARVPFHPEDLNKWERQIEALFASGGSRLSMELRVVLGSGTHWYRLDGMCFRNAAGRVARWTGSAIDVTPRKLAEEALRVSEQRYSLAMEGSEEGHFDVDLESGEFFTSERINEIYGLPTGKRFANRADYLAVLRLHEDDVDRYHATLAGVMTKNGPDRFDFEYRILRPSGEVRWLRTRGKVTRDAEGHARRRTGTIADITDAKLAEQALRESKQRYELAMAASESGYWDWDVLSDRFFVSERANELIGLPPETTFANRADFRARVPMHPDDWPRWDAARDELFAGRGERLAMELRYIVRGETRWHALQAICRRDESGKVVRWTGSATDITARKQAEEALRDSEARKSGMFETALDCIVSMDHTGRIVEFNPAAEATFGYRRAEALGTELAELIVPPRLREQHRQGLARYMKSGETRVLGKRTEMPAVRADGTEILVELSITRIATQAAPLFTAYLRDITARKRIEEALRQSEERYALAVEGSNEGIFDWDLVTDRVYVSYRAQELLNLPRGDLWRPRRDWRHILHYHPDDVRRLHDSIKAHIEGAKPTYDEEFRVIMPDGGLRWYRQRGIALRDASGKAYRVVGSLGDVTDKHRAAKDLSSLERKLRLAQRLEAMGTLAGGIAHDFNNLLGAILGYGEMALRDAPKGSRLARDIDSIVVAGERGRALVERVLAFSRSGVGERVPVHVERVVREALDMVSAKLRSDVSVRAQLNAGNAAVLGDATQVHQVMTNLATNAVQAMPNGGTLRVELALERVQASRAMTIGGLTTGEYVVLKVADSGGGIAPEILERIFDPFFTTKEVGTGTGLGLSLVHGIVTELGGAIDVASAVGTGSAFTVYLPRSGDAVQPVEGKQSALPRGSGQRVLVVDDEEPLVQLATRTLADLGYVPTGFTSSAAALEAFRADPERFDALITDERMPEMSGTTLIREVRGVRSALPVVLMSGYLGAKDAKADEVLQKPLLAGDLAASLARVLQVQSVPRRTPASKRRPARSSTR